MTCARTTRHVVEARVNCRALASLSEGETYQVTPNQEVVHLETVSGHAGIIRPITSAAEQAQTEVEGRLALEVVI